MFVYNTEGFPFFLFWQKQNGMKKEFEPEILFFSTLTVYLLRFTQLYDAPVFIQIVFQETEIDDNAQLEMTHVCFDESIFRGCHQYGRTALKTDAQIRRTPL